MVEEPQFLAPETLACRAGYERSLENEHSEALFLSSSFCFESAAQAAARFAGEQDGNVYSRFTNPTVRTFETRLALLEGGEAALATASGMGAISTLCFSTLAPGDHIVASRSVFGTTVSLFDNVLPRFGIETTFVDLTDPEDWQRAIRPDTKMLFLETPSNPLAEIGDIEKLAGLARDNDALLVVDNCLCTPVLQRPLAFGADVVVHSATKYLDGQGRCVGGAIVGRESLIKERCFPYLRTTGSTMSAFNAWVFIKGLETLAIRMERHSASASRVAKWLDEHKQVARVFHPSLASHSQHALACKQQGGPGGIVTLDLTEREIAWRFIDSLKQFSITGNLGDAKSIVTHPSTTTHGRLSQEQRARMQVTDGLVRLSIGLEDPEDLITDIARALDLAQARLSV
ncbi:MAG: O-succinylhomoserine sulfhydrylase [Pseudomonadota bacterium]